MANTLIQHFSTSTRTTRPSYLRSLSSSSALLKDKPRLYVVLYPRGGNASSLTLSPTSCDAYHWALVVGPQMAARSKGGARYHVVHTARSLLADRQARAHSLSGASSALVFEQDDLSASSPAQMVLVRVAVAKVKDPTRVAEILRSIPIPDDDPAFSCLAWVRTAFCALHEDGCLKSYLDSQDWREVEACARRYCKRKRDERRSRDDESDGTDAPNISTWNFWENRETEA